MNDLLTLKTAHTEQDILTVEWLAQEIWSQHFSSIVGQKQVDYMLKKFQSAEAIETHIKDGYVYYIAYYNGNPCGYSAIKREHGVFLSKFYVLQSHRGKGIGKAMLSAIYAYAKTHSEQRVWLTCNKENTHTLAIYKQLGFNIIDDVIADIGEGFVMDDYVLEKTLHRPSAEA